MACITAVTAALGRLVQLGVVVGGDMWCLVAAASRVKVRLVQGLASSSAAIAITAVTTRIAITTTTTSSSSSSSSWCVCYSRGLPLLLLYDT